MMVNKKVLYFVLGTLCFSVIALSVAFAALSNTLTINFGNVTQEQLSFGCRFETTGGAVNTTVAATPGGTSDTGRTCNPITISSDGSYITVGELELSKPDDSCQYDFRIKNTGTIGLKLSAVTPTKPKQGSTNTDVTCNTATGGSLVCGNLTYTLSYNSSGTTYTTFPAAPNLAMAASATKNVRLLIKYTGTSVNTSSAVVQRAAKYTVACSQS